MHSKPDRIQIRARRVCPECNGCGIVPHPCWELFWKTAPQGKITDEYVRQWFSDQGFGGKEKPPEEIWCDLCGGTGLHEFWLDLAELVRSEQELGDAVARGS